MQTHNLVQGSAEWHAYRASHFNASDAPAMLGESKYKTRNQLLDELSSGISKEINQRLADDGHRFEALARPLAEEIIGEELYPVVGSDGIYSASFDGLTMAEDIAFEHKSLNDDIRSTSKASELHIQYRIQMEQQLMVAKAKKNLFLATKWDQNDVLIDSKHFWYESDPALRQRIIDGWAQFEKDLANHKPRIVEKVQAEVIKDFPVAVVQAKGEIILSNLNEVFPKFDAFLASVNTSLVTDDDFANGEATAKFSRDTAKKLKLAAEQTIDQIASVSEVVRGLEQYAAAFDKVGLTLEKAVKDQKEILKTQIISAAITAYDVHMKSLDAELGNTPLPRTSSQFAAVIKGKRTLDSIRNAVDTELAACKMTADALARDYRAKRSWVKEHSADYDFLLHDLRDIIAKPMEDFQNVVNNRITEFKATESARLQDEEIRKLKEIAEKQKAISTSAVSSLSSANAAPPNAGAELNAMVADGNIPNYGRRPSSGEIISVLAKHFRAPAAEVINWLCEMDLTEPA
jgi:putative phage-type endonuclease